MKYAISSNVMPELRDKSFLKAKSERVLNILHRQPLTFFQLLRKTENCDPLILDTILNNCKKDGLLRLDTLDRYTSCKNTFSFQKEYSFFANFRNKVFLAENSMERNNVNKHFLREIKESLPEPSPAYSQWWFHDSSYPFLYQVIFSQINNYSHVAFIGAPSLGTYFSRFFSDEITLFDIDDVLLKSLGPYLKSNATCMIYDVFDEIGKFQKEKFDLVYCDPPWDFNSIILFLRRAFEMCIKSGHILISLPPLNTRSTVKIEQEIIYRFIKLFGGEPISFWPSKIRYDMPKFEKSAYLNSGIDLVSPWRVGDLLLIKKKKTSFYGNFFEGLSREYWKQFTVGKCRFFLKNIFSEHLSELIIKKPTGYNNFKLRTTSSRELGRKESNMLTSRGHCAIVQNGKMICEILEELSISSNNVEKVKKRFINKDLFNKRATINVIDTLIKFIQEE